MGCQKFVGFQGGKWRSVHIDELSESSEQLPRIDQLVNRSISDLFKQASAALSEAHDDDDDDDDDDDNDDDDDGGGMEVDRDDIEKMEENNQSDDSSFVAAFDPALILRNCLQAAAARVFDDSAEVN